MKEEHRRQKSKEIEQRKKAFDLVRKIAVIPEESWFESTTREIRREADLYQSSGGIYNRPKSILIPHQLNAEHDILASFIDAVTDYCTGLKGPRFLFRPTTLKLHCDSIMRYYGISGDPINLRQIGALCSVSRERVRQIQAIHLWKINQLFNGHIIDGLKCDCVLKEDFNNLRDRFFSHKILTDSLVKKILLEEGIILTEERNSHLKLFFDILGIKYFYSLGKTLYFTRKEKIDLKKLHKAYEKIKSYLIENFSRPIPLKVLERDLRFPAQFLKIVIPLNFSIEETDVDEYQIKNSEISGFDVAYRVLLKTGSMILPDLSNAVNELRGKQIERLNLSIDKRFKCVGKTSRWILAETDINSDCYYQLVEKTLNFYNRPCSFREIFRHVQKEMRPNIKLINISGAVHVQMYKKFYVLNDNRVILEAWKMRYKKELKNSKKKKEEETFTSVLIRILKDRAMYGSRLKMEILKAKKISLNTCIQNIYASEILNKRKKGNKNVYSLKPNYEDILNAKKQNDSRKIVAEFIFDLFKKEKKSNLTRKYIVEQILSNLHISKPFIYKYLRESEDVFDIKIKSKRITLISLKNL